MVIKREGCGEDEKGGERRVVSSGGVINRENQRERAERRGIEQ